MNSNVRKVIDTMRELGSRKAANAVLAFPLAACVDIMGYNHLVHVDDDNSRDLDLCTQSGSEDYGENASVAYTHSENTLEINDQHIDEHRYLRQARRERKHVYRTQSTLSLPPRQEAVLSDQDVVWSDEERKEIPRNTSHIDQFHGVLRNSTPLFESIRRGKWKLASSFLQKRRLCRNTMSPKTAKDETRIEDVMVEDGKREEEEKAHTTLKVSPLELARTWTIKYETDGTLLWRRLPLHEALRRGAPADLVYTLLELYPLAAEAGDTEGNLPLHLAMQYNAASDIVQIILQEYSQAMETPNERGKLPLECVQSEAGKDLLLPIRGHVLQRYVDSAKEIAYRHIPQLKTELFQVNKTIEGAKSELRLAKLELNMTKEHHRLLVERKVQDENNMKEEVQRLRAELETLKCEREQLAAEKELWAEQRQQDPYVVSEVLSSDYGNNGAWISNEFNHMVTQLEQTSRLVHRNDNAHAILVDNQGQAGDSGNSCPSQASVRDIMNEYASKPSNGDMGKNKKASNMVELQECRTDATELTDQQLSSEEEYEENPSTNKRICGEKSLYRSRAGSDDDDSSTDQGKKFNSMLLSIIQQADDDGALPLPVEKREFNTTATRSNASRGSKEITHVIAHPRKSIKPAADTTVRKFPMPSTRKTSNHVIASTTASVSNSIASTTASVSNSNDNQETTQSQKAKKTTAGTADEGLPELRKKFKSRNKIPSLSKALDLIEATRDEPEPTIDPTEQVQNETEPSQVALPEGENKIESLSCQAIEAQSAENTSIPGVISSESWEVLLRTKKVERLSSQAIEAQSSLNTSIAGVRASESWEVFLRTNKADNQSTQEQRLAALWKTNAMAEGLVNLTFKINEIGAEGEESNTLDSPVKANLNIDTSDIGEEGEEGDTLGPLVKAKPERKWRSKIREKLKKTKPSPETPKSPRRETRDEDDSTARELSASTATNGDACVQREKDLIEETRESLAKPFKEFDDSVNKALTKLSERTSSLSHKKRHHHRRGKSKAPRRPGSRSTRQEQNIYVACEDKVEILTSDPQIPHFKCQERNIYVTNEEKVEILTSEPELSCESRETTAASVGPYRPHQFSDQDSVSIVGYNSLV